MKFDMDALIVGGGPAGLGAALSLGRMRRKVLVCDDSRPRNAPSHHVNNLPALDGIHPAEWRKQARADLAKYSTVQFYEGTVLKAEKRQDGFFVQLKDRSLNVRKLILTDGIADRMPPVPGIKELWGVSIFHCAYCHGYEVAGTALGVLGDGEMLLHGLPMFNALSRDLVVFTNGPTQLKQENLDHLRSINILVEQVPLKQVVKTEQGVQLHLEDGRVLLRKALFMVPVLPFQTKSSLGEELGCEKNEWGLFKVNPKGMTSVAGVYAGGDNMTMAQSVLQAAASGSMAGAGAVHEMAMEDFMATGRSEG